MRFVKDKGKTDASPYLKGRLCGVFCFLLLFSWPGAPQAAEDEPFAVDSGKWSSVGAYEANKEKEAASNRVLVLPDMPKPVEPVPLDRPLHLPAMPGLAQSAGSASSVSPDDADDEEDSETPRTGWHGPDKEKKAQSGLNIRLTTLPNAQISPIPADRVTRPLVDRQAAERADAPEKKKKAAAEPKVKANQEACEALASLRRRQLEALESDRQTLADLHKALSELGLSEKLNFMDQAKAVPDVLAEQPAGSAAQAAASPATKPQPAAP